MLTLSIKGTTTNLDSGSILALFAQVIGATLGALGTHWDPGGQNSKVKSSLLHKSKVATL